MPDPKETEFFPKGRLAMGAGDFQNVFDISWTAEDGIKGIATLRRRHAGETDGAETSTLTFKMVIGEEGFEKDILGPWRRREKKQLRLKVPGKTITQTGRFTKPQITSNVDGAIEFQVSHLGALEIV